MSQLQTVFELHKQRAIQLRASSATLRIDKLKVLKNWLLNHRIELQQALHNDFKKPAAETDLTEYYLVKAEIDHTIKYLRRWMRPKRVKTPLTLFGSRSSVILEPKGVCLIIGPWNYPFSLMISPLVSAIAAGNTVFLKPSEITAHTSALMAQMVEDIFEKEEVFLLEGGLEVSTELLALPFDHIFFTGSPKVGKIVMQAASKHLTSVTLELGGKSPNIIDETAHLKDAAEKVVFNKFLNGGQTCIAPDYILVHQAVHDEFVAVLKEQIKYVYDENLDDMAGIVNSGHFHHLKFLLKDALEHNAKIECGGELNEGQLRISPTLLTGVDEKMKLLEEEIFGPILPVLPFQNLDEAINRINAGHKPLALYIFSGNSQSIERVLKETSAGGVCVNDGNIHFSNNYLPFGGVNNSGIGKSHGFYGFRAFSNEKAILRQRVGLTSLKILYPPYTKKVKKYVDLLLKWL